MVYDSQKWQRIFWLAIASGIAAYGLVDFLRNLGGISGNNEAGLLVRIMVAVITLACYGATAGTIFGFIMGEVAGEKFIDFLLYHREFLSAPPILVSHAAGLIRQHDYAAAEAELQEIIHSHPDHQQAVLLLGRLYLDELHRYAAAVATVDAYLQRDRLVRSGDLDIVNLRIDAGLELREDVAAIRALIERELDTSGYTPPERHALEARCEALSG